MITARLYAWRIRIVIIARGFGEAKASGCSSRWLKKHKFYGFYSLRVVYNKIKQTSIKKTPSDRSLFVN